MTIEDFDRLFDPGPESRRCPVLYVTIAEGWASAGSVLFHAPLMDPGLGVDWDYVTEAAETAWDKHFGTDADFTWEVRV